MAKKTKPVEIPAAIERQSFKCPVCGKENFGPFCLSCGAVRGKLGDNKNTEKNP